MVIEPPKSKTQIWNLKTVSLASTGLRENAAEERYDEVLIAVKKTAENFIPPPGCNPTPSPTPEPDACLLGKWVVNNASYLTMLQAAGGGGDEIDEISGQLFTEFDSEWNNTNSTNGFAMTLCSQGDCLTIPLEQSGTTTYSVDGDQLTVAGGQLSSASIGSITETVGTEGGSAQYSCQGNTLLIDYFGLPTVMWSRVTE
ncbi:MAG: hypothetical protein JRF60_16130 [Deltaproteobacteria bacterium]|nr:hypothetical protein [Deltaproteobacteria bacterium]